MTTFKRHGHDSGCDGGEGTGLEDVLSISGMVHDGLRQGTSSICKLWCKNEVTARIRTSVNLLETGG
jgi:hypothetical protein